MIVINQREVLELLSMKSCIDIMESVFVDVAQGDAMQALRSVVPLEADHLFGVMPSYLRRERVVGAKVITVFTDNHQNQLPSHQGFVSLFDADDGTLQAIVDGQAITAIRTAAVSAVATKWLARQDAQRLAMVGSGEQARSHLEAMLLVRPIRYVKVWSPHVENAKQFQTDMSRKFGVSITVCERVTDAVADADIICTVTSAKVPVLQGDWVSAGAHVNAVGACRAQDRELDTVLVKHARLYVDSVQSAHHEAGDYLIPVQEGAIGRDHIVGEMGELLTNRVDGRRSSVDLTVFKSLGLPVEDMAAANYVYREAIRQHMGTQVAF